MNLDKIHDILDCFSLEKSTNSRALTDKLYNAKNQRSSLVSKKSVFDFDMNKIKFSAKLPKLATGATGARGENKVAGSEV